MGNKDNKTLFSTADYAGRTVIAEESTWVGHVVAGHPEMTGEEYRVMKTIEKPEIVYESCQTPKRELFFARHEEGPYPAFYTTVVVEYNNSTGGLITAYFRKDVGGVNGRGLKYVKTKI